jgi:hypothetical protein
LAPLQQDLKTSDYFFFDMSFPQMLVFSRAGFPVSIRLSEFEPVPIHLTGELGKAKTYWLDGFESDWWIGNVAIEKLVKESRVTVVSPEIHGREPSRVWDWFAQRLSEGCDLSLCTDFPVEAGERISWVSY